MEPADLKYFSHFQENRIQEINSIRAELRELMYMRQSQARCMRLGRSESEFMGEQAYVGRRGEMKCVELECEVGDVEGVKAGRDGKERQVEVMRD